MSGKKYMAITCDWCGIEFFDYLSSSLSRVRSVAKTVGWHYGSPFENHPDSKRDLCPRCAKERGLK